jgi:hypothetical protein
VRTEGTVITLKTSKEDPHRAMITKWGRTFHRRLLIIQYMPNLFSQYKRTNELLISLKGTENGVNETTRQL